MKMILASLATVLLGAAVGWRPSGVVDHERRKETSVSSRASIPLEKEVRQEWSVLGVGWRAWAKRVETAATQAELEELYSDLIAALDQNLQMTVGKLIGARWFEVDAMAGVHYLSQIDGGGSALYPLLSEWVAFDQKEALEAIETLGDKQAYEAHRNVLSLLLKGDPDVCLGFIRTTRRFADYGNPRNDWRVLARARPDAFADLIVEIETENLKKGASYSAYDLIRVAADTLTERDPDAALDWAEGLFSRMRSTAIGRVLRTWAEPDLAMLTYRLSEWKSGSGTTDRSKYYRWGTLDSTIARGMASEDLATAAEWLGENSLRSNTFTEVLALEIAKGEKSFEEVFNAISAVDSHNDKVRTEVFRGMWDRMTNAELDEAFDILRRTNPESGPRTTALGGLLKKTIERDPAGAVGMVKRVAPGPERNALVAEMMRGFDLGKSGYLAEAVVSALPSSEQAGAIGALFSAKPISGGTDWHYNPEFYGKALAAAPASPARAEAVERVALQWGQHDPDAAMEWAASLPGDEMVQATIAAARGWAPQDSFSLSSYLLEMQAGPARDGAAAELVESVRESEPDSAWQWAAQIDEPDLRLSVQRAVVDAWVAKDSEEARTAIDAANLSVSEREALRAAFAQ